MTQHPFGIVYDLTGCFYVGRAYIRNRRQWDGIKYGTAGGTSMQIFQEKEALQDVSFTLQKGICGLLGENGAGKSTLMRIMATVDFPTKGNIRYGEMDIFGMDEEYRSLIGYMPQDYNVYPGFTAKDFLEYMGVLKGIPKAKLKDRIMEVLEFVNLSEAADKKVKTFSGGMKRRIGIAQAIINEPKKIGRAHV